MRTCENLKTFTLVRICEDWGKLNMKSKASEVESNTHTHTHTRCISLTYLTRKLAPCSQNDVKGPQSCQHILGSGQIVRKSKRSLRKTHNSDIYIIIDAAYLTPDAAWTHKLAKKIIWRHSLAESLTLVTAPRVLQAEGSGLTSQRPWTNQPKALAWQVKPRRGARPRNQGTCIAGQRQRQARQSGTTQQLQRNIVQAWGWPCVGQKVSTAALGLCWRIKVPSSEKQTCP